MFLWYYIYIYARVCLFGTPWTIACQAPLSMEFFRQEYWNGLSFPSPGDLPDPGIELASPVWAGGFFTTAPPRKPYIYIYVLYYYYYYMYRALSLGAKFLHAHHKTLMLLDHQTGLEGNWKGIICILNIKEKNLRYFVPI